MEPEFAYGDEVMIVCPAGAPPFPEGPVRVLACTYFDKKTQVSAYVVEYEDGRRDVVDGFELVSLDAWAEWMQKTAN